RGATSGRRRRGSTRRPRRRSRSGRPVTRRRCGRSGGRRGRGGWTWRASATGGPRFSGPAEPAAGRIRPSREPPVIGRTLSHYRIEEEISRGGMGIVYRAVDVKLNREVALKVLPPDLVHDP